MMISAGFTAPLDGKKLASTLTYNCDALSHSRHEIRVGRFRDAFDGCHVRSIRTSDAQVRQVKDGATGEGNGVGYGLRSRGGPGLSARS
jgi:hypothetical protein